MGRRGEDVACSFLERLGHRILERNYRSGHLEIDIISVDGCGLHFVEVKSRVAPVATEPEESVTRLKQCKITKAALGYLHRHGKGFGQGAGEVFFDVLAVTFDRGEERVEWFPGAYIPLYM